MSDPRYDARYQRGYVVPSGGAEVPPIGSALHTPVPRVEPMPREVEPPRSVEPVPPGPDPVEAEPAPASALEPDTDPAAPGRNPFRIALAALGIVLVATTGVLLQQMSISRRPIRPGAPSCSSPSS